MVIQTSIEVNRIQAINELHNQIGGYLRMSLDSAIHIGELLTDQKESMAHGEFTTWIDTNLPFTDRTARNYMRLYQGRDKLKTESVSVLTEGYKLLAEHAIDMADMDAFDRAYYYSELCLAEMSGVVNSPEVSISQLSEVQHAAFTLQNEWALLKIRAERKVGGG